MHFVFKLPEHFIIKDGITKKILRDSLKGILPNEILNRKDKIGFAPPEEMWIKDQLFNKIFKEKFIDNKPFTEEFLDMKKLNIDFDKLRKDKQTPNTSFFKILFLELWYQNHFSNN